VDYFISVDNKRDFIVINGGEQLTNEPINGDDIEFVTIDKIDGLKKIAWSSNCKWTFIIQPNVIYLINIYNDLVVRCKKKSKKFIEMFLDTNF